jgi:beta-phosphoglucomutase-like phosphatase (HAD superfamily)
MFQAVLFEIEGVLADTRTFRQRALQETFAQDGVRISDSDYESYADLPVRAAAAAAFRAAAIDADEIAVELAALRAERRFMDQLSLGFTMVDGARELVAHLAGRVRLGLVTRAGRREAETILALAGLEFAFECVVTTDQVKTPKPAAESYEVALRTMSRLRPLQSAHTLALEDGPVGIRAARTAGVRCLAVGALPAHRAMQAEGLLPTLRGHTLGTLEGVVLRPEERIA